MARGKEISQVGEVEGERHNVTERETLINNRFRKRT